MPQARDWKAVREVSLQNPDLRLRVASRSAHADLAGLPNVEIRPTRGVAETNAVYDAARITLVCVKDNCHASGITVLLEAVARGAPVVCADQGGLGDYFSGDELWFYGPGRDHATAAQAVAACRADPVEALRRARDAQRRLQRDGYDSLNFVRRIDALMSQCGQDPGRATPKRRATPGAPALPLAPPPPNP